VQALESTAVKNQFTKRVFMSTQASKTLETFANPNPGREFTIRIKIPEFTCLCPMTRQPDFATFDIEYIPDKLCVELKSLKLYMWSYREEGAFHEAVTNTILDDLIKASKPLFMRVTGRFNVRGGIYTDIIVEHRSPGWKARDPVTLP
jgi:7-cyano-7-deazaguanine reductase